MKITRIALFLSVLVTTGFLLTACNSETANITDKNGKSISVSSPDSDTYTFKLPSEQTSDVSEKVTSMNEEAEFEQTDSDATTVSSNSKTKTEESSEGPKTGEP